MSKKAQVHELTNLERALVETHLHLVLPIAKRWARGFNRSLNDLVQEGYLGLIRAAQTFDPKRSPSFEGYAGMRIKGVIRKATGDQNDLIRIPWRVRQRFWRIRRDRARLEQILGREPTSDDLIEKLGISPIELYELESLPRFRHKLNQWADQNGESGGWDFDAEVKRALRQPYLSERQRVKVLHEALRRRYGPSWDSREWFVIRHSFGLFDPRLGGYASVLEQKCIARALAISSRQVRRIRQGELARMKPVFVVVLEEWDEDGRH